MQWNFNATLPLRWSHNSEGMFHNGSRRYFKHIRQKKGTLQYELKLYETVELVWARLWLRSWKGTQTECSDFSWGTIVITVLCARNTKQNDLNNPNIPVFARIAWEWEREEIYSNGETALHASQYYPNTLRILRVTGKLQHFFLIFLLYNAPSVWTCMYHLSIVFQKCGCLHFC